MKRIALIFCLGTLIPIGVGPADAFNPCNPEVRTCK